MIHPIPVPHQVTAPLSSVVMIPSTATGNRNGYCTVRYRESNKESASKAFDKNKPDKHESGRKLWHVK